MKREIKIVIEVDDVQYREFFDQLYWYLESFYLGSYAVYMDVGSNKVIEQ